MSRAMTRVLVVVVATFLVLSAGLASADQIVLNGSFDSDLSNWVCQTNYYDGSCAPSITHDSDAHAAKLQIQAWDPGIFAFTLSQPVTIPFGATIGFDVKFANGESSSPALDGQGVPPNFFQAYFLPADGSLPQINFMGYNVYGPYDKDFNPLTLPSLTDPDYGWYHFTGNVSGIGTLNFELSDQGAAFYSTAWVDNVSLTESNPVPEPATILLFGAGIARFISSGSMSLRRKKLQK